MNSFDCNSLHTDFLYWYCVICCSLTYTRVVQKWLTLTNCTVALSTYSPPRSVHRCHLSGNFWTLAGYHLWGYCAQKCGYLAKSSFVREFSPTEWFFHFVEQCIVQWDQIWRICSVTHTKWKNHSAGENSLTNDDLGRWPWLCAQYPQRWYPAAVQKLPERWQRCTDFAGSMSKVLQCNLLPIIIRRLVTQVSVDHLWMTLVFGIYNVLGDQSVAVFRWWLSSYRAVLLSCFSSFDKLRIKIMELAQYLKCKSDCVSHTTSLWSCKVMVYSITVLRLSSVSLLTMV
jgi:hypothetical protein